MRTLWFSLLLGLHFTATYAQGPSSEGPSVLNDTFYRAELYRLTGRTQQAIGLYKKELPSDDKSEVALYQLGRIYAEQAMWSDALALAEKAASLYPDNLWIQRLVGQCQLESGLYQEALQTQLALVRLKPNDPQYLENVVRLSWGMQESELALSYLDQLEAMVGASPELLQWRKDIYLSGNKAKKAEKVLQDAVKKFPEESAYVGLLAQFYAEKGDLDKGVRTLRKGIESGLSDFNLYLELAKQLQAQGQFEQSMDEMINALRMPKTPVESMARTLLSLSEHALNDTTVQRYADEIQRVLLEVHGENSQAWFLHARDAELREDWSTAIDAYQRAVDLGAPAMEILPRMVEIHVSLQEFEAGNAVLDELLAQYPNDPKLLIYAAYTYYAMENKAACIEAAERFYPLAMVPNEQFQVCELAAEASFELNNVEQGALWFDRALELDSNDRILNNYAWQLAVAGVQLDKALRLTKRSNEKSPWNPTYLDTWAWVLYKAGDWKLAQEKIQLALRFLHEHPDPVVLLHAAKIEEALGNEERAAVFREQSNALNSK